MAITEIIPTTTALPAAPSRQTQQAVEFYVSADTWNDAIETAHQPEVNTTIAAQNVWATQANSLAVDVNVDADRAEAAAGNRPASPFPTPPTPRMPHPTPLRAPPPPTRTMT